MKNAERIRQLRAESEALDAATIGVTNMAEVRRLHRAAEKARAEAGRLAREDRESIDIFSTAGWLRVG